MTMLSAAFRAHSPRHTPRRVPFIGLALGWLGPLVLVLLFAQTYWRTGIFGWSVGLVYIAYDTFLLAFTARQLWPLRNAMDGAPRLADDAPRPTMGIIVAARNEAPVLKVTIDGLAEQEWPPELIILADDGSNDGSDVVMREVYGLTPPPLGTLSAPSPVLPSLRWLRLPHGGKARALNTAIPHVDTELMLTIDADTLLAPRALRAMREAFAAEPELVAATGVLAPICGPRPVERMFQWFQSYEYVRNFLSRFAWMQQDALLLISGAFAGFRASAVREVGGFDPDCLVEDYELIHRMHRTSHEEGHNWTIRVIGRALAYTDAPASPMAFLRQRRRWFGGFLQTQYWNRDMVGNPRFGHLGTRMLVVKALDTVQPIYGLTAFLILLVLIARHQLLVSAAILSVMLAKVLIDLTFHFWSISLYKRWTGEREGLRFGPALLASFIEPLTFQLLRHAGATWGWVTFLKGSGSWGNQTRTALAETVQPAE